MRIIHVMDTGGFYGKEHVVYELIKQQNENGHNVWLICLGKEIEDISDRMEKYCSVIWLHMDPGFSLFDAKYLRSTINGLKTNTYDCIAHSHCTKSAIYLAIQKPEVPIVRTVHGYTATKKLSLGYLKQRLDQFLFRRFDKIVGVSDNMMEFGVDTIIPNGISEPKPDLSRVDKHTATFVDLQEDWAVSEHEHTVIGCIARLSKEKNLVNLILSMRKLPNHKLIILGEGPERKQLEFTIKLSKLNERVHLVGFVPNPTDYIPLFDIYIQPSITEGLPISVLEAIALKKPCVLSSVGGMKKIIAESAAFQLQSLTPKGITDSIEHITQNELLQETIVKRARELFEREYTSEIMANSYDEVYINVRINRLIHQS